MDGRITVERDGHVLLIGIDRAAKRNAFDRAMLGELARAWARLDQEEDVRVGVLFAHGDHFSAGLDLADVAPRVAAHGPAALSGEGEVDPWGVWGKPASRPVVMAVQGMAYTLSIELALAVDVVVAADDVQFRQLEVGRGILPFGGATFRAPAQLGWGNAMRFLLTGEAFGAEQALRIGLVQEVVPVGQQLARATEIAQRIAAQAPLGVQATLENARKGREQGEAGAIAHLQEVLPRLMASEDAAEGLQSFLERRTARFTGR